MNQKDTEEILKTLDEDGMVAEAFRIFNYYLADSSEKCMQDLATYGHGFIFIDKDLKPRRVTLEDIKAKFKLEKSRESQLILP